MPVPPGSRYLTATATWEDSKLLAREVPLAVASSCSEDSISTVWPASCVRKAQTCEVLPEPASASLHGEHSDPGSTQAQGQSCSWRGHLCPVPLRSLPCRTTTISPNVRVQDIRQDSQHSPMSLMVANAATSSSKAAQTHAKLHWAFN